jgi:hypothetical protein
MEDELFKRYLKLLGIRRTKPDTNSLREIVKAHLSRVSFEMELLDFSTKHQI